MCLGATRRLQVAVFVTISSAAKLFYYLAFDLQGQPVFVVYEASVAQNNKTNGPTPTKISPVRGNLRFLRCLFAANLGN